MPTITLTDRKIASLKPTTEQIDYFDRAFPGFGVRVSPNGRKSFVLLYRTNKKLRRLTIGTYPEPFSLAAGRAEARQQLTKASEGRDPATEQKQARAHTWAALGVLYIERHAKRHKRSWRDDARMIRQELDVWGDRPVASIRRADVRELLEQIVDRGAPVLANRVLALVRKMLNFAIDQDWIDANPAAKMARPGAEKARSRVLSENDIRAVVSYLDQPAPESADATERRHWTLQRAALRLRLVTAQRGGEVVAMRWRDIDGDWWTIPAEHAKNKLPHRVPLTAAAHAVLATVKTDAGDESEFVFAGIRGTRQRRGALDGLKVKDVRPHDFRRTAASLMAGAGVSRLVIAKVLNHAEKGITAVYDRHSYDAEKRLALDTWARTLQAITTGRKARVVPIRRRS